jgi:hypothetical protein
MADRVRGSVPATAGMRRQGLLGKGLLGMMAAAFAVLAVLAVAAPHARAASLLEKNFWLSGPNYSGIVPACDEREALNLISMRFSETERMYWNSNLAITGLDKISEIAFRPWGPEYQPRRYCSARVYTNDNKQRAIYYSIIEDGGLIGASWGVEWCIVGLDRNYAYAPSCKMARP